MTYALIKDGSPILLSGAFTDANDIQHPASVLQLWTEEELLEIGVHKVIEDEVPEDVAIVGTQLIYDGEFVRRIYETIPVDIDVKKINKKSQIDAEAEAVRNRYLTPGSGQAITYQAKAAEAVRYSETGGQGDYPFLSEEVGITGDTLASVAATVLTMHHEWQIIGGQIERERLRAKKEVDSATTIEQLNNINPVWP